jgi:hypothetical protein
MKDEYGKYMEGNDHGPIEVPPHHLPEWSEENREKHQPE